MKRFGQKLLRRFLGAREGAAAVEFAFALPIFTLAVLVVVETGRVLWAQNALHYAVEETARCMTVNPTACPSPTTYAANPSTSGYSFFTAGDFTVTPGAACGNLVAGSYPFPFLTSIVGLGDSFGGVLPTSVTLTARACFPSG